MSSTVIGCRCDSSADAYHFPLTHVDVLEGTGWADLGLISGNVGMYGHKLLCPGANGLRLVKEFALAILNGKGVRNAGRNGSAQNIEEGSLPMALPNGVSVHRGRGETAAAGNRGCRWHRDVSAYHNYLFIPRDLPQVCFVECKASRADFLRDHSNDGQMMLCMMERKRNRRSNRASTNGGAGKFAACLLQPMANIHYVLAPAGIIQKKDLPPRWGLLSFGEGGVNVVVRAEWQELGRMDYVESAIARTLTGDIYRADDRAINSVNRELFAQQQRMAEKIRSIRPQLVLAPGKDG